MEIGLIIVLVIVTVQLVSYFKKRQEIKNIYNDNHLLDMQELKGTLKPFLPSIYKRFRFFLKSRFSSRPAFNYEMAVDISDEQNEMIIKFYVPRKIIYIEMYLPSTLKTTIKRIELIDGNSEKLNPGGLKLIGKTGRTLIRIYPPDITLIGSIHIEFDDFKPYYEYELRPTVVDGLYEDFKIISDAMRLYESGMKQKALDKISEYMNYSTNNYVILNFISTLYGELKKPDKGQEFAIKAAVNGLNDAGLQNYISMPGII